MNLRLNTLHLKNFLSFADETLAFNESGYILVNGLNENPDDLATSNGSGKSSIFEAIIWCLTGETVRGTKEVTRQGCDDSCEVTLTFNLDKNEYTVCRSKDPSNLRIFINGEDKSGKGIRDTSILLNEYLPDLTSSLLGSVVVLGQGLPQRFTNNTPAGRKDVLEKLSKSDFMIEDLKRRVAERNFQLRGEIRVAEDNILQDNTKVTLTDKQIEETKNKLAELDIQSEESLNISIKELENKISNVLQKQADLHVEEVSKEILKIKDSLNALELNYLQESAEITESFNNKLSPLTEQRNLVLSDIRMLEREIEEKENIIDICPTCGQKIPDIVKPDLTNQKQQLAKLYEKSNFLHHEILKLTEELNDKKELLKNKKTQDSYQLNIDLNNLNSSLVNIQTQAKALDSEIKKLNENKLQLEYNLSSLGKIKEEYKTKLSELESLKVDLSSNILYNNNVKETLEEHLEVITKMSTSLSRDFRGYLLVNVIDFINEKAKEYSNEIFETDKINFVVDNNNISISYDGKEYENLSGGEKQKVDLIVQLAIRDMLCTYLDFSCNILVVDELFDALDLLGCQKVLNLITTKVTDVEAIYVITHRSELEIPCDRELTVVKGADKISRIRS